MITIQVLLIVSTKPTNKTTISAGSTTGSIKYDKYIFLLQLIKKINALTVWDPSPMPIFY